MNPTDFHSAMAERMKRFASYAELGISATRLPSIAFSNGMATARISTPGSRLSPLIWGMLA